jgi:hypothetical protein
VCPCLIVYAGAAIVAAVIVVIEARGLWDGLR